MLPEVAVTVTPELPTGVPPLDVPVFGALLEPQPIIVAAPISSTPIPSKATRRGLRRRGTNSSPKQASATGPPPRISSVCPPIPSTAEGAVVVNVNTVVPLVVTVVGVNTQAVPYGRPAVQAKLTVPVKLFTGATVKVTPVEICPGAVAVAVAGGVAVSVNVGDKFTVTVRVALPVLKT
jgi:hypothetical protein